jgi:hypothetical protein
LRDAGRGGADNLDIEDEAQIGQHVRVIDVTWPAELLRVVILMAAKRV